MKTVLVTGANGFVGRAVCERLLDDGWCVIGGIRRDMAARDLPEGVDPWVLPDLTSPEVDWTQDVMGFDAVIHLVARTHVMDETESDPLAAYRAINVDGTRRLLEGCVQAGVGRFLYMSSIKAVGESNSEPYTETTPCKPEDAYGQSKREAEQMVLEMCEDTPTEPIIVRSPLIYGPGVKGNLLKLIEAIQEGKRLPVKSINNLRSMVSVVNLADSIAEMIEHPAASDEIFHVADEEAVSTPELVNILAAGLGVTPKLVCVPKGLLKLIGRAARKGDAINRLTGSLTVSSEKVRTRMAWKPPVSIEQGLKDTVAAYLGQEASPPATTKQVRRAA